MSKRLDELLEFTRDMSTFEESQEIALTEQLGRVASKKRCWAAIEALLVDLQNQGETK